MGKGYCLVFCMDAYVSSPKSTRHSPTSASLLRGDCFQLDFTSLWRLVLAGRLLRLRTAVGLASYIFQWRGTWNVFSPRTWLFQSGPGCDLPCRKRCEYHGAYKLDGVDVIHFVVIASFTTSNCECNSIPHPTPTPIPHA